MTENEQNCYKSLACGIVEQAAVDWRALLKEMRKGVYVVPQRFISLRSFFKREWCVLLVGGDIADIILKQLEKEYLEAKEEYNKKEKENDNMF